MTGGGGGGKVKPLGLQGTRKPWMRFFLLSRRNGRPVKKRARRGLEGLVEPRRANCNCPDGKR